MYKLAACLRPRLTSQIHKMWLKLPQLWTQSTVCVAPSLSQMVNLKVLKWFAVSFHYNFFFQCVKPPYIFHVAFSIVHESKCHNYFLLPNFTLFCLFLKHLKLKPKSHVSECFITNHFVKVVMNLQLDSGKCKSLDLAKHMRQILSSVLFLFFNQNLDKPQDQYLQNGFKCVNYVDFIFFLTIFYSPLLASSMLATSSQAYNLLIEYLLSWSIIFCCLYWTKFLNIDFNFFQTFSKILPELL